MCPSTHCTNSKYPAIPSGSNTSCFPLKVAFKALRVNLPCGAYIPHKLSCIAAIYIPFPGREIEQASKGVHQWEHAGLAPSSMLFSVAFACSFLPFVCFSGIACYAVYTQSDNYRNYEYSVTKYRQNVLFSQSLRSIYSIAN